jgi:hypothetical protein
MYTLFEDMTPQHHTSNLFVYPCLYPYGADPFNKGANEISKGKKSNKELSVIVM